MADIPISFYIDWTGLESFDYCFDSEGLPRVAYGGRIGLRYSPITIAQYGLYCFGQFDKNRDERHGKRALNCCEWLYENARDGAHDSKVWVFDFDLPFYGPKAPWISAMAQGEAVSLLLRGSMIGNEKKYESLCSQAVRVFQYPVSDHGVVDTLDNGSIVFEEYPTDPPSHVLNGHVFSLLGLYDYAVYFEDEAVRALALSGLNTLERHWNLWDTGYWTRYDLHPTGRLASNMYHELHIRQFKALAKQFDNKILNDVARRWRRMQRNPLSRIRWFGGKIKEKTRLRGHSI